ncbi:MAG: glycosyltransferase family 39 protein [Actinomycetota bacterium]|nr:glycosyltransferase family 39 protein [Actinomycetota bacterium]
MSTEPERNVLAAAPDVPESSADVAESDSPAWLSTPGVLLIAGITWFSVIRFVILHGPWLRPTGRDLIRWLEDPTIGGPLRPPAGAPIEILAFGICLAIGWWGSELLLHRTSASRDRPLRCGLTLVLAIAVLGYVGMAAVVAGRLSAGVIWLMLGVFAIALAAAQWRIRPALGPPASRATDGSSRWLRILFLALCGGVLALIAIHAIMSPVQEWDATVYHAETARRWFLERPSPTLVFGPSVGFEISANYPPLFPASGAAMYTLIGRFDDFSLRVTSPVAFAGLLLMLFGWTRHRFDVTTARVSVVLALCPLTVLYAGWPTGYVLLAALFLAVVILVDLAAEDGGRWTWVAAGVVAGLAILTHAYGILAIPAGLAAVIVRRQRFSNVALFVAVAAVVASPWLLRNLVQLHDPFYPLGSPLFHGKGLVEPMWSASKAEIKTNALGYWGSGSSGQVRTVELSSLFFDRHLPAVGAYVGMVAGFAMWRRQPRLAFMSVVLAIVGLAAWLPGWYWLRALIVAVPVAAVLGAWVLISAWRTARRRVTDRHAASPALRVPHAAIATAGAASLFVSGVVALALAIAGPNQATWTTNLGEGDNLMQSVENLGAPERQLWTTFGGDVSLWDWINNHMDSDNRVATLDVRTYYLDAPQDLFYLDGLEAEPLAHMTSSREVEDYLLDQGVRFVAIPGWSVTNPSRHPLVSRLSVFRFLGSGRFPVVAVFPTGLTETPSLVYAVGPTPLTASVGIYPGRVGPPGRVATISVGIATPRIGVPLGSHPDEVTFEYESDGAGSFDLNLWDPKTGTWRTVMAVTTTGLGWQTLNVPLPRSGDYAQLGIYVRGAPVRIRAVRIVPLADGAGTGS